MHLNVPRMSEEENRSSFQLQRDTSVWPGPTLQGIIMNWRVYYSVCELQ